MGFEITDGTGRGNAAGVDETGRLLVRSVTETIFQNASEEGEAYFIGSPIVTATTSGSETALLFIKNNEDSPLILGNFFTIAESTASGSPNMFRINWYRNPTSMSNGTAVPALNQNFGSSDTLDADIEYGDGTGSSSFTGGQLSATLSFPIGVFNDFAANLVLEKGSSVGISVTPPAGNTNMPVQFGARSIKYVERY